MAMAINHFLQYDQYIGSSAAFIWAISLNMNSKEEVTGRKAVMLWILSLGISVFAVVWLLREKDLRVILGRREEGAGYVNGKGNGNGDEI
ncbi:hypothetical protein BOTCAL_0076g00110 [Botryotinia calthae]|uniref:Uncharacterized protein n=1 Tax=Botryotinia calthae TaxID=38488 RepID=A0A4Y8D8J1_9HELO|nr:hypothetical protein BOTCAL_0076g00110 [Botryotinia calthae]